MKSFPLEPIEKAPVAELRTLQLERLRWSLQHAYDNVPQYRRKFDAAGVIHFFLGRCVEVVQQINLTRVDQRFAVKTHLFD